MRIDSLYLKDVGPFDEVTIDFPPGTRDDLADVYLLTGENGCGKSTVLYAIASLLGAGTNSVGERMRSSDAKARLTADGRETSAVPGSMSGALSAPQRNTRAQRWVAFAYSGARRLSSGRLRELKELDVDPLEDCLSFHQTANTQNLALWLAGQDYKRLKAKEVGEHAEADRLQRPIRDIEMAVGEIIQDASFTFASRTSSLDVLVKRQNATVDLDLLPDGVKSIVSWVADLIMRMDRIAWIDNRPIRERPFLLLLDEIDIHLHPAWQRRILPMVARLFPKAQIIASTHSPFVVASAEQDAHIIRFNVKDGRSTLDPTPRGAQVGNRFSTVAREIFDVPEFDVDTEAMLKRFHELQDQLASGRLSDRTDYDRLARDLAARGEELSSIIGFEVRQLERQLARAAAG